jgi:hypothetical protein
MADDFLQNGSNSSFPPVYREVQYFVSNPIVLLSYAIFIAAGIFLVYEMIDLSSKKKPSLPLLLPLIILGVIFIITLYSRLIIEVTPFELKFKLVPFMLKYKVVELSEIESCEAVVYKPIVEYGGWGIRCGRGGTRAYNVSGNEGVVVKLKNGKKFLLGSKNKEELQRSIVKPI